MGNYDQDFGPFEGRSWINASHQGALPRVAAEEAQEAIAWKQAPYQMTTERFQGTVNRMRNALARLINAPTDEIVLANSASYGLHLLANGIPWKPGDEIILTRGDFPSDILPWLGIKNLGVRIKLVQPRRHVLQLDELEAAVTPATRLVCCTWVHSFSGFAVDEKALGDFCRSCGIVFFLNCSQALGARPLDITATPVDAVTSVGFKWLCGPYGTGFLWMKPELRDTLEYNKSYWLSMQTADDLGGPQDEIRIKNDIGARKYDIFGTANFFNYKPWASAVEYILKCGVDNIARHDQTLVDRFIDRLDRTRYDLLSPEKGPNQSTLIIISHKDPDKNKTIHNNLNQAGVHGSFRAGNIRFSPHLYNTEADIDRALDLLHEA